MSEKVTDRQIEGVAQTLQWWAEGNDATVLSGRQKIAEIFNDLTTELATLQTLLSSAALIAFQDGTSIYRDGDCWRYCRDEVESESDFGSAVEAWEGLRER